jgi:hypothetical protein
MRINEELLERKSSGSGLENREYRPWGPNSRDRSVVKLRLQTKGHEVCFSAFVYIEERHDKPHPLQPSSGRVNICAEFITLHLLNDENCPFSLNENANIVFGLIS